MLLLALEHFDKHYHPNSIYFLLEHMGFSWITSRSKPSKQSQKAQDDFKKSQIERSLKFPVTLGERA
ncbi:winged helix-turn-helix domain-containing protein [Vibrio clamense]|uniref:winged helix-turn-helix domain-containing protein n=1 Tax=Vibrio clamense TaxID=2910254 RepID=UPI003D24A81C